MCRERLFLHSDTPPLGEGFGEALSFYFTLTFTLCPAVFTI